MQCIFMKPTDVDEVTKTLKIQVAVGINNINVKMFKKLVTEIAPTVSDIVNRIIM